MFLNPRKQCHRQLIQKIALSVEGWQTYQTDRASSTILRTVTVFPEPAPPSTSVCLASIASGIETKLSDEPNFSTRMPSSSKLPPVGTSAGNIGCCFLGSLLETLLLATQGNSAAGSFAAEANWRDFC